MFIKTSVFISIINLNGLEFGKENVALKTLELQERLTEIFQHLHENPEVSWKEYETTAYITNFLKKKEFHIKYLMIAQGDC